MASQHGKYGSSSSSNSSRVPLSAATPRYMPSGPSDEYAQPGYFQSYTHGYDAAGGTGESSNYQLSSSDRGRVTNANHHCTRIYTTWSCGHETSETKRHNNCWECSDHGHAFCHPEPVDIDKWEECARCKAYREADLARRAAARERDTAAATAARGREAEQDRWRERSPGRERNGGRRRSF